MALSGNKKEYQNEVQLPCCCVPTCLRMIFNRRGISAPSQEDIGNRLGLIVPPIIKDHFNNVAVSDTPPYGTRINLPEYDLNNALRDWNFPLRVDFRFIDSIPSVDDLKQLIGKLAESNDDCILCVQSLALYGRGDPRNGHVVLLTEADADAASFIDPGPGNIGSVSYEKLYEGMVVHGQKNYGGCWIISDPSV